MYIFQVQDFQHLRSISDRPITLKTQVQELTEKIKRKKDEGNDAAAESLQSEVRKIRLELKNITVSL